MSKFKKKAEEVLAEGTDARGDFTPHGVPKRMYSYWLGETSSSHGIAVREGRRKENFCHFWRVVAIWSPLMFLKNKFLDGLQATLDGLDRITSNNGLMALVSIVFAAIIIGALIFNFKGTLLAVASVGVVILGAAALVGFLVSVGAGIKKACLEEEAASASIVKKSVIGLIPYGIGFVIGMIVICIDDAIAYRHSGVILGVFALLVLVAFTIFAGLDVGWLNVLAGYGVIIGVLVGIMGLVIGLTLLGEKISASRSRARRATADQKWQEQEDLLDWVWETQQAAFFAEHGRKPYGIGELFSWWKSIQVVSTKPSKIKNFFSGIADFLVLLAQIVRVNKWKICPIVTIEDVDSKASV